MGKQICLLMLVVLFSVQFVAAKKFYYSIPEMTAVADLIVSGKIISVSENTYLFAIEQSIKGKENSQITVKMFEEWTCDTRWKKAEIGQSLLLFLTRDSLKNTFNIINGSTGEIFIVDGRLQKIMWVDESPTLDEAKTGIKNFLLSYTAFNAEAFPQKRIAFKRKISESEIKDFRNMSKFSTWLFDQVKNFQVIASLAPQPSGQSHPSAELQKATSSL